MELSKFLIMRSELSLIVVVLILLLAEIFVDERKKPQLINWAAILFLAHTALGFVPANLGILFGGMYVSTELTVVMKNILNVGVLLVILMSSDWLKTEANKNRITEFFILMLSTLVGMNYMISSGDFLMFYLGLELATIPLAALVAYKLYDMKSTEAGVKLILLAAMSSGIMLYGISMIYGTTGSVYFDDVIGQMALTPLQVVAMVFFLSGLAFKISLVPFHLWTADVYEGSPTSVAAYLSVISKGAATFVMVTLLFSVFRDMFEAWHIVLFVLSVLTMTVGNLFALRQTNIQRFLAFSSVAQAGFILLGMISGTEYGMATVLYFVLVYIFSNLGAFGVVAVVRHATGKMDISDYDGFYSTNPRLSLVMLLSLFSLAGIPPVAGFFGKFFLFAAAASQGHYLLLIIAVLNTIISLYYYLIVVKSMMINKSETPIEPIKTNFLPKIAITVSVLGIVLAGVLNQVFDWVSVVSWGL